MLPAHQYFPIHPLNRVKKTRTRYQSQGLPPTPRAGSTERRVSTSSPYLPLQNSCEGAKGHTCTKGALPTPPFLQHILYWPVPKWRLPAPSLVFPGSLAGTKPGPHGSLGSVDCSISEMDLEMWTCSFWGPLNPAGQLWVISCITALGLMSAAKDTNRTTERTRGELMTSSQPGHRTAHLTPKDLGL